MASSTTSASGRRPASSLAQLGQAVGDGHRILRRRRCRRGRAPPRRRGEAVGEPRAGARQQLPRDPPAERLLELAAPRLADGHPERAVRTLRPRCRAAAVLPSPGSPSIEDGPRRCRRPPRPDVASIAARAPSRSISSDEAAALIPARRDSTATVAPPGPAGTASWRPARTACSPAWLEHVTEPRLPRLVAERPAAVLRQRARRAERRRGRVVHAADRVEVVAQAIAGRRLDDQQRPTGGSGPDVPRPRPPPDRPCRAGNRASSPDRSRPARDPRRSRHAERRRDRRRPRRTASARARSIDGPCESIPTTSAPENALASATAAPPWPQPTSAIRPPARSRAATPSSCSTQPGSCDWQAVLKNRAAPSCRSE